VDINLGVLKAYVRLDFSKLKGDSDKAKKQLKDLSQSMTRQMADAAKDAGRAMTLGITAPLIGLGKAATDAAVQMEDWRRGLKAITGSSKEAETQLKRLRELSKIPGLTFEGAVKGSINLQAAGLAAKDAERSMRAFANAIATVGGSQQDFEGVMRGLRQMLNKGKISAEEVNQQIGEFLPGLQKHMKAAFGTADPEVLQKAGVSAQQFVSIMTREYEKLSQIKAGPREAFEEFNEVVKDGLRELGQAILPDVTKAAKELGDAIKNGIQWWKGLSQETRQNILRFGEFALLLGPLVFALGTVASAIINISKAFGAMRAAAVAATGVLAKIIPSLGRVASSAAGIGLGTIGLLVGSESAANAPGLGPESARSELKRKRQSLEMVRGRLSQDQSPEQREQDVAYFDKTQQRIRELYAQIEKENASKRLQSISKDLDAEMKKIQAQVAKTVSAGDTRKAEIARNKAEAAARKAQAARDRRAGLLDRVFNNADRFSQAGLDAQIADWVGQWRESETARRVRAKASDKLGGGFGSFNAAMSGMSDMNRALRETAEANLKKAMKKASGFMSGASNTFSGAMGMLSPLAQKAAEETAQRQTALADRVAAHQQRMGRISLQTYLAYLEKRLAATRGNLEEEMRLEAEVQDVKARIFEQKQAEIERKRYEGWQNLARGMEGVFANAFNDILSGSKDFFQSLLDGFKQMVAAMLAQALAAGLMRSLFGGGNFLTGFLGVFGFDNASNDAMAHRWGRDFSHHFTDGAVEYGRTRAVQGASRMAGGGAGPGPARARAPPPRARRAGSAPRGRAGSGWEPGGRGRAGCGS